MVLQCSQWAGQSEPCLRHYLLILFCASRVSPRKLLNRGGEPLKSWCNLSPDIATLIKYMAFAVWNSTFFPFHWKLMFYFSVLTFKGVSGGSLNFRWGDPHPLQNTLREPWLHTRSQLSQWDFVLLSHPGSKQDKWARGSLCTLAMCKFPHFSMLRQCGLSAAIREQKPSLNLVDLSYMDSLAVFCF